MENKKNIILVSGIVILLILFVLIFHYTFFKNLPTAQLSFVSMNTIIEVKIYDQDQNKAFKGIKVVYNTFDILDSLFNPYSSKSDLAKLKLYAGKKFVKVSPYTYEIVKISKTFHDSISDLFNIALDPIIKIWKRYAKVGKMPCKCTIKRYKALCNMNNIILIDSTKEIFLKKKFMGLDFGAIAKGYALYISKKKLDSLGIKYYIINAGGDIYLTSKNDKPFKIGIKDPFNKQKIFKILYLKNTAIATSGDYERFYLINGKKFSHIINPRSGYPQEEFNSSTVITPNPIMADIWATVLSIKYSPELLKKLPDSTRVILINKKDTIYYSSSFN